MKQAKQQKRTAFAWSAKSMLSTLLLLMAMLVPQGAWADDLTIAKGETVTITEDTGYGRLNISTDGTLIIHEGVKLNVAQFVTRGTVIVNQGATIYVFNNIVNMSGGSFTIYEGASLGETTITMGGGTLTNYSQVYKIEINVRGKSVVINHGEVTNQLNMHNGTAINYGTIENVIINNSSQYTVSLANHGEIKGTVDPSEGTLNFYNTGTYDSENSSAEVMTCAHETTVDDVVEATCTHDGGKQTRCQTCYQLGDFTKEEDALGHNYERHNIINYCTRCGHQAYDAPEGDGSAESPYQIASASNLYWFADKVNNDYANFKNANAKLTADIVVNDGTFDVDGSFIATDATEPSTPIECVIGRFNEFPYGYSGTFDGQGHTISGLYANYIYSGLFGFCDGATIQNVGIINSYFEGDFVGAICGVGDYINNCYSSNVICKGSCVGGIIGLSADVSSSIKNCYSTASLINTSVNDYQTGGIAGQMSGSMSNCYTTYNQVCLNGTITRCEASVTADRFESGEIAWLLNGSVDDDGSWTAGKTDGTQKWYQTIGTDANPVLAEAEGNTVYYGYENCASENMSYANSVLYATKAEAHILIATPYLAATCTTAGNCAYWTCSECEKVFVDEEATTETTVADQTITALSHSYDNHTLTTAPVADGLYAYACDRGCDEHSDDHIVKGDEDGNIFELTVTTVDGTTTYSAASVTIEDGKAFASPVDFTVTNLEFKRSFDTEKGMYTVMVPFAMTAEQATGFGTFYTVDSFNETTETVTLAEVSGGTTAHTAYIFKPKSIESSHTFDDVLVKATVGATLPDAAVLTSASATGLYGTYQRITAPTGAYGYSAGDGSNADPEGAAINAGSFVKVGTDVTLPAYRAVLWVNGVSGASAAPARLNVDLGNGETSLGHLGFDAEPLGFCYDLNGNMVSEPRRGEVFIMNGRKYIIK